MITRVIGLMGAVLNLKMWFLFVVSLNSFKFLLKADCGILSIIGNGLWSPRHQEDSPPRVISPPPNRHQSTRHQESSRIALLTLVIGLLDEIYLSSSRRSMHRVRDRSTNFMQTTNFEKNLQLSNTRKRH